MSVAVLWKTSPFEKPSANSCFLIGKYSCQFDSRVFEASFFFPLAQGMTGGWQSNKDSLSWPLGDSQPRNGNGCNCPSSNGFKPIWTAWVSTNNIESVASMRPKTIKRPGRVADVAILILCFSLHSPPSGRCRATNCWLERMRHVWKTVCGSRFRQINKY